MNAEKEEIKNERSFWVIVKKTIREFLAIISWLYFILSVFVFSVDIFLIKHLPGNFHWIVTHKFIVVLATILVICLITRKLSTLGFLLYIVFYPFVLIFYLGVFLWGMKSWPFLIGFLDFFTSLFNNLKFKFFLLSFFVFSAFIILTSQDFRLLWVSICLLLAVLFLIFIQFLIYSFKTPVLYKLYIRFANFIAGYAKENYKLTEELKTVSRNEYSELQLQTWSNNLQQILLVNKASSFFAKKLKEYHESKISVWLSVLNIVFLIIITFTTFSFIYFALYKINPSYFYYITPMSFGDFFYFSFNYTFLASVSDLSIWQGGGIKVISMLHRLFSVFVVGGIVVTVAVSQKQDKITHELEKASQIAEKNTKDLDVFIDSEFGLTPEVAITELQKVKAGLLKIIIYFSH